MAIIDISRTLDPDTGVWPGDTPFQMVQTLGRRQGDSVNLTTLTLSAHTGTHVDAPWHFTDEGAAVDALDLAPFWGLAQVVSVNRTAGGLAPADFAAADLNRAPRLLVRSAASLGDPRVFPAAYVYPTPELAAHLAGFGIILYGTDGPSMDAEYSKTLDGHRALHEHGIAILEWLDLSAAADGLYELAALPLKVSGGDGSPVRAALRPLER